LRAFTAENAGLTSQDNKGRFAF